MPRLVAFVSSHGFGHAARVCALLEPLAERLPGLDVHLVTATPRWFFEQSLRCPFTHQDHAVDLGMVQANSLDEDLRATVDALAERIPFADREIDALAAILRPASASAASPSADLALCDIAPLGLAAARRAGVPSLLMENFTWDWIYRGYLDAAPDLAPIVDAFAAAFRLADHHLQTEPVCSPTPGARSCGPISRRPRENREATRRRLGIPDGAKMVLVTMGGIPWDHGEDEAPPTDDAPWLVLPGSRRRRVVGRSIHLPHHSDFYHPDLIQAADAVVGKLGYSTLAEVARVGVPFGYVTRERFPESPKLEAWVRAHLPCRRIEPERFIAGDWRRDVDELASMGRADSTFAHGAEEAADWVAGLLRTA